MQTRNSGWFHFLAGVVLTPITVILHEGSHWVAARHFGFLDVKLHPFGVDYLASDYAISDRLIVSSAGWLCSAAITFVAACFALRKPHPIWTALTLAGPLRGWIWVPGLVFLLTGKGHVNGGDEFELATRASQPILPLAVISLSLSLVSVWILGLSLKRHTPEGRLRDGASVVAGVILGFAAYFFGAPLVLGP